MVSPRRTSAGPTTTARRTTWALHARRSVASVLQVLSSATTFVCPSLHEPVGTLVLEAMACGCPVIGADRTSIPEVIGGAGLLFDPDDEDSLVDQIKRIATGSSDGESMVALGLQQASRFRWADVAHRIDNALKNVA